MPFFTCQRITLNVRSCSKGEDNDDDDENKADGAATEVTTRSKPHEKHHDDCVNSFDGLGKDVLVSNCYSDDDGDLVEDYVVDRSYLHFAPRWFTIPPFTRPCLVCTMAAL